MPDPKYTGPCSLSAPQSTDGCAMLPALRMLNLMSGKVPQNVSFNNRHMSYSPGNVKELKAMIRQLEITCRDPNPMFGGRPMAVRSGPYVPAGTVPGYGFPFGRRWPY